MTRRKRTTFRRRGFLALSWNSCPCLSCKSNLFGGWW